MYLRIGNGIISGSDETALFHQDDACERRLRFAVRDPALEDRVGKVVERDPAYGEEFVVVKRPFSLGQFGREVERDPLVDDRGRAEIVSEAGKFSGDQPRFFTEFAERRFTPVLVGGVEFSRRYLDQDPSDRVAKLLFDRDRSVGKQGTPFSARL